VILNLIETLEFDRDELIEILEITQIFGKKRNICIIIRRCGNIKFSMTDYITIKGKSTIAYAKKDCSMQTVNLPALFYISRIEMQSRIMYRICVVYY